MADEIVEKKEEVVTEKKEVEKKENTEIEKKALEQGWNPNWEGAEEEFIDAAEFVRRKPLFDKIESQKKYYDRKLKEVETTLTQLAQHHTKVKETEYQRAFKDLRDAKRAALKEGDTTAVLEFEDKMEELTETHQTEVQKIKEEQAAQNQSSTEPSADFQVWVKSNTWYVKDDDMHDFADGAAAAFVNRAKSRGTQITEQDVFDHVLDKVRKAYPEKFENPNRERPSTVVNGDRQGKVKSKELPKLPPEYEDIARNFEKSGTMKREVYIQQLVDMGVI